MPRENTIVGAITRELDKRGAWHVNIHGAGVGRNGVPDILACHLGQFLAIECKQERGRASKLQEWELERVACAGGTAIVARTIDQLRDALDEIETMDQARQQGAPAC